MNLSRTVAELESRQAGRKLFREYAKIYDPDKPEIIGAYPWQVEFHNAGDINIERMVIAGSRTGKTQCAAAETACHATGAYPSWWKGRKFEKPVSVWCGSESNESSRDIIQLALLGPEGSHGTGWIPKSAIVGKVKYRQAGVSEVVDTIKVKHSSGGVSTISMKTYEQGRKKWQGTRKDVIWLDEESPMDIYTEAMTRTLDAKGITYVTFTPLQGPTELVVHFLQAKSPGIYYKNVTWDDAPHLDKEQKDHLWNSYSEYERDTRVSGLPMMGSGLIFPIADEKIIVEPFEMPHHFARINGIDFGIDHPGAGVFCAWDRDGDTFYIYDAYKKSGETTVYHADAMKKHGNWIPNAWPADGLIRDKGSGVQLKNLYKKKGLFMLKDYARYQEKEKAAHVEPGLIEMLEYMRTGRLKVFSTCGMWFEEKRLYHRKDGKVVALNDDIMSASRYAFVMRRMAITKPYPVQKKGPRGPILGMRRWKLHS